LASPTTTSRPGRLLTLLAALIVVLVIGVLGGALFQPSHWDSRFRVGKGLDISSGTTITLKAVAPPNTSSAQLQTDLDTAQTIMNSRVNGAGFNGASVTTQSPDLINVSVPGKGAKEVENLVGTTAQLRFRQVLLMAPNTASSTSASASLSTTTSPQAQGNASLLTPTTRTLFDKLNCASPKWRTEIYGNDPNHWDNPNIQTVTCYQGDKYALDKAYVTGEMLKLGGSSAQLQSTGDWWVTLSFNGVGTKAFGQLSTRMFDNYTSDGQPTSELDSFAVVLDGTPVAVPSMGAVLDTGTATIRGSFTESQADNLSNVLNYGALPLTFTPASVQAVSAQLGSSQLQAGLRAGALGLLLVVVYALLYYRGLGVVSVSSLAIAALLTCLAVVLLSVYESFVLSLAGIAGLIVAIGITADSFVVFFERLRDQVRDGNSLRAAVEHGWVRARRTILLSDTVSFIAAAVLYKFAVGDVQNFAFTLGLTTIIDVVVVFLFTKPVITLLARTRFYGGQHKWSGLDPARLGMRSPWRGSRHPGPRPRQREGQGAASAGRERSVIKASSAAATARPADR
jgi:preprotein translocase subunit SecD